MSSLDALFGASRSTAQKKEQAQTIKEWTRELFSAPSDTVVMVTENDCRDPRCPGIETVIALLEYRQAQRLKLSKPMIDVTKADIVEAIRDGKVSIKTYPDPSSPDPSS